MTSPLEYEYKEYSPDYNYNVEEKTRFNHYKEITPLYYNQEQYSHFVEFDDNVEESLCEFSVMILNNLFF